MLTFIGPVDNIHTSEANETTDANTRPGNDDKMKTYRITKTVLSGVLAGIQVVDTHQASDCKLVVGKKYKGYSFEYRVVSVEIQA